MKLKYHHLTPISPYPLAPLSPYPLLPFPLTHLNELFLLCIIIYYYLAYLFFMNLFIITCIIAIVMVRDRRSV